MTPPTPTWVNMNATSFRQQSFIFSRGSLSFVEFEPRDDRVERCRLIIFEFFSIVFRNQSRRIELLEDANQLVISCFHNETSPRLLLVQSRKFSFNENFFSIFKFSRFKRFFQIFFVTKTRARGFDVNDLKMTMKLRRAVGKFEENSWKIFEKICEKLERREMTVGEGDYEKRTRELKTTQREEHQQQESRLTKSGFFQVWGLCLASIASFWNARNLIRTLGQLRHVGPPRRGEGRSSWGYQNW